LWWHAAPVAPERERWQAATPEPLPSIAVPPADIASVTRIELTRPDDDDPSRSSTVTLERANGRWRLTSPISARASAYKVGELLTNLTTLYLWKVVDRGTGFYDDYDLTEAKALHVTVWKGAAKATELFCGKSSAEGQLVRLPGVDGIFALVNWGPQGYAGFLYTRDVRSWRDSSIFAFDPADVAAVEITNRHGVLRPEKADDLLRAYHALAADDFGADADRPRAGIDDAAATGGIVRIKLKGRSDDLVLRVGRLANQETPWAIRGNRFAMRDGDDTLYIIAPWTAAWAIGRTDTNVR
jgi:hypothetical protein